MLYIELNEKDYDNSPRYQIVDTVAYWKENQYIKALATKAEVENFLSANNGQAVHYVVNYQTCNLSAFFDTPGYCDGDKTTTVNKIIEGTLRMTDTERATTSNMHEMITSNKIMFFTDPGHGWLRVPLSLIKYLGIGPLITRYSYADATYAYLEEDCDLTRFFEAIGLTGQDDKKELCKLFWSICTSNDSNYDSPIRSKGSFDPKKFEQRTKTPSLAPLTGRVLSLFPQD